MVITDDRLVSALWDVLLSAIVHLSVKNQLVKYLTIYNGQYKQDILKLKLNWKIHNDLLQKILNFPRAFTADFLFLSLPLDTKQTILLSPSVAISILLRISSAREQQQLKFFEKVARSDLPLIFS